MPGSNILIGECARVIYDGFLSYNRYFARITRRAQRRFETRDWRAQYKDTALRVEIYETAVNRATRRLTRLLGREVANHALWQNLRGYFGDRVENMPDAGFVKTFFNSITRRIFGTVGTDPKVEFISPAPDEGLATQESLSLHRYPCWGDLEAVFQCILADFRFRVPYADSARDARFIVERLLAFATTHGGMGHQFLRFEFIDATFYQASRAYLVGRMILPGRVAPMVIALESTANGIRVDAVLLEEEQVSVIFSYTRSYYFANPTSVVAAVRFLHSILPHKPIDELYTVLGRLRQGKTERYRVFTNHLQRTADQFVHADGDKGLVMIVFTLPSHNLVFKVIRDQFGYPKTVTHAEVIGKYKLVSRHDHAGRLIDTQEFRNLELPYARFSERLLEELTGHADNTVRVEGNHLVFSHIYVERRVRPLNLYIREVNTKSAVAAILDYGRAIKDLAETNIFPGDLLLKNFGLTAQKRVVFYDYDEVALVTDCRFREIPDLDDEFDTMHTGSALYVGRNDIFPEEFIKFLGMDDTLKSRFLSAHGDLLTADYWRTCKNARLAGEVTQVVPYGVA